VKKGVIVRCDIASGIEERVLAERLAERVTGVASDVIHDMRNDDAYPLSSYSALEMAKRERIVSAPDLRTDCERLTECNDS